MKTSGRSVLRNITFKNYSKVDNQKLSVKTSTKIGFDHWETTDLKKGRHRTVKRLFFHLHFVRRKVVPSQCLSCLLKQIIN